MWGTRRLSCSRTWPPASPARSSTSTPASATWWLAWAARLLLLRRRRKALHFDVGLAAQAGDEGLVLRRAEGRRDALAGIGGTLRRLGFGDLGDAQQDVAAVLRRHADVGRQLADVGRHRLAQQVRRKALRLAARYRARRAPGQAGGLALAQLLELGHALLLRQRRRFAPAQHLA